MLSTRTRGLLFIVLCAGSLAAQGRKPNFSGTWKMDPAKSDYGTMETPQSVTRKIVHEEPNVTMVVTQKNSRGDMTTEFKYATDGKEYVNKTRLGEARSTLRWDGDALLLSTRRTVMGRDLRIDDRWTLSADGRTMTITGKITGGADNDYTIVFEKQ